MEVNMHQAKTHLSRLVQRAVAGEEITIARAGVALVRLVVVKKPMKKRPMGMDRGKVWIADDFDAPLPDDLLKAFYGGELPPLDRPKAKPRKRK
jgi:antitoxin (DNA-binding transcriptional repressor) of toxin-antitoxin stability system